MLTTSQALPVWRCTRSWLGAVPAELTQTGQRNIHSTECHAQYTNQGKLIRRGPALLWNRMGISKWWTIALCLTSFSWVLFVSFCCLSFHYNRNNGTAVMQNTTTTPLTAAILFQLLNCSYLIPGVLPSFWFSFPSHGGMAEVQAACYLVADWS